MISWLFGGRRQPSVPPFESYYPTRREMDWKQRQFYDAFVRGFHTGQPLQVDGQISYIFCLAYHLIDPAEPLSSQAALKRLSDSYEKEPKVVDYIARWRSDCFLLAGAPEDAFLCLPDLPLGSRATEPANDKLNIALHAGHDLTGADVLSLVGPKVTKYARAHLPEVAEYLNVALAEMRSQVGPLLPRWAKLPDVHRHSYTLFRGTMVGSNVLADGNGFAVGSRPELPFQRLCFDRSAEVVSICLGLIRNAENAVREDIGMPRVGEGWVAETKLFYEINEALPDHSVEQHASPAWLGRQHLDIFIESLGVAIEFQGEQHDRPVEFFGGEDAFRRTQQRDHQKRRLCGANNVRLIEVRKGYSLVDVIQQILQTNL